MKKFKIGYFADGPWSHDAFDLLITNSQISIEFIVPRIGTKDETLKKKSNLHGIDYFDSMKINSDSFLKIVKPYNCDLFVSMSFDQIFKHEIMNLPVYGTINCHAGKLPFYRGRNVLNWVLINGEKEFGITVHFIDKGIDTGDIILQKTYPISDSDNYETLLKVAYRECGILLHKAITQIIDNSYMIIKQENLDSSGSYCERRVAGDEKINWEQHSLEIFNFIRGICYPGPSASTFIKKNEIKINKSNLVNNRDFHKNKPGEVLEKTNNGFLVKTLDDCIEIREVSSEIQLKSGDQFES